MKILQVFDLFSLPHGGGTVDILYRLSRALAEKEHEVVIYTSDFELDQEYIDSLPGVKVQPFHSWLNLPGVYLTPGLIGQVSQSLKDFDIIHLHCFRSFQNIVIHHYAMKFGVPYVLQAHGSLPRIMMKQRLKQMYDILWGDKLLRDAARVIAVTRTEAEQYKSIGVSQEKIEVVPHGIDLSEFDNLPERGEFRAKYGLGTDDKIILSLGRIHKIKGLDLLVRAFAGLSKLLHGVKLVVVGSDDGYLISLKKLVGDLGIGDKTFFTGPLYGREKLKAYVDADVYVLPSVYEIFGMTLLEAFACGTPVIVTDRCGLADVIDREVGLVVSYDKEPLQHALLQMLEDDKMRLQFGEKGRLLVREKFSCERTVNRIEAIYQAVLTKDSVVGIGEKTL